MGSAEVLGKGSPQPNPPLFHREAKATKGNGSLHEKERKPTVTKESRITQSPNGLLPVILSASDSPRMG
jgi:hypothetical protein